MDTIDRVLNAIWNIAQMFVVLLFFAGALPLWILASNIQLFSLEIGTFRFIGLLPIVLGIVSVIGGNLGFIMAGGITPCFLGTPEELVVTGLYQFVRNPIYLGFYFLIFGEACLFESSELLLYLLLLFFAFHLVVVFIEEPVLKSKFGESYERYCKAVPRWIPHLRDFRGHI